MLLWIFFFHYFTYFVYITAMGILFFAKNRSEINSPFKRLHHAFIDAARYVSQTNEPDLTEETAAEKLKIARSIFGNATSQRIFPDDELTDIFANNPRITAHHRINVAAGILKQVIQEEPDNFEAYFLYSQCLCEQGKGNQAKKMWEDLVSENPDNPHCLIGLGEVFYRLGEYAKTRTCCDQALKLQGDQRLFSLFGTGDRLREHAIKAIEENAQPSI